MKDDRSDCPDCRNPLRVMLRYDYNIQRANMFGDHVEEATVYVVDPVSNTVVDYQTARNSAASQPLKEPMFAFNFEGLKAGNYRLFATGRSAAEATIGITTPSQAESIDKLKFALPVTGLAVQAQRLDTVWNTLKPIDISIPESEPTEATVDLMRLTNDLSVIVFRRDTPIDNGHERYDVSVTDNNPIIGYDNEATADSPIAFSPFASWTTETMTSETEGQAATVAERNAHYDFSLFRLISNSDARHNPRLIIRNRETGHEIVNIDLCYYLALARNAYETEHYGTQEYLDREYDYRLDFGIEGSGPTETWKYMTVSINVLSWVIRIQNEEL